MDSILKILKLITNCLYFERYSLTPASMKKTSEQLSAIFGTVVNNSLSPLCQSNSNHFSKAIANIRSKQNCQKLATF